ncbi:uncharacterized protein L201_005462 [Kwoniella dendrophila CBS 6074]|uniref:RRM domain-containing protein n=1 Tax=Kwoniella dendrophila CBS 6074 TaxID=1295534 RepID=A0AAX4JYN4_9TREE
MPKATTTVKKQKTAKSSQSDTSTTVNNGKSVTKGKGSSKLYSGFLPIPLILPSFVPMSNSSSSSSSKPVTSVKHYIYARPHTNKSSSSSSSASSSSNTSLPDGRTLFVTNLPVDASRQDLRTIFGKWGIVEDIKIGSNEVDVLEQAVRGLPVEDLDDEEDSDLDGEDEDEVDENQMQGEEDHEEEEEENQKAEPQFQGDGLAPKLSKNQKKSLRRKAKNALPPSVPSINQLPSLNPRSEGRFDFSGSRSCHLIYLDPISIDRLMCSSLLDSITLAQYGEKDLEEENPIGLEYYTKLYETCRPDLSSIKSFADSSMNRFDYLHGLLLSSRAKKQGAGALVDEDGFTVVVRSGKYGRAGSRGDGLGKGGVGVASRGFDKKLQNKKKGQGAGELKDFYKFQRNERKRQELADLRSKFESDKQKVEELKKSRRFKPY